MGIPYQLTACWHKITADDYLYQYYNGYLDEELGNTYYDIYEQEIEQAYEDYELQKDIESLLEERTWDISFRYIHIRRIAIEAKERHIQLPTIFKFFKEYDISDKERVWFWMKYYYPED